MTKALIALAVMILVLVGVLGWIGKLEQDWKRKYWKAE
jgi:hypothetical protein